jgi:circadian clock protein KaiB
MYKFRLYVVGDAPNSTKAILNLRALCNTHLPGRHEIEIIDVLLHPERALADGVLLTPLLLRVSPAPVRRMIGNLSHSEPMMAMMEVPD